MIKVNFKWPVIISQHHHPCKCDHILCFAINEFGSFTDFFFSYHDITDKDFVRTELIKSIEHVKPTDL